MAHLILIRHGESEWNALGRWTGLTEVSLSPKGIEQARQAAHLLRDIPIHQCHLSSLSRTHQTWQEMAGVLGYLDIPKQISPHLNERDYGTLTGKNKWEVKTEVGEEQFHAIRRSWDHPVPGGETLKMVHARVVPYFEQAILPSLKEGKNIVVCSHGNTIRALKKHLDVLSDEAIVDLEIGYADAHVYTFDTDGNCVERTIRSVTVE